MEYNFVVQASTESNVILTDTVLQHAGGKDFGSRLTKLERNRISDPI